jgi:hypothetical protein
VHGGALHLAFNLLMLVWCGWRSSGCSGAALILLYVVGAYARWRRNGRRTRRGVP